MKTLTKEQIRLLTPAQQKTICTLEAGRIKTREQLLEQARGYRGRVVVPVAFVVAALGLLSFGASPQVLVAAGVAGFWMLIQFHVAGINRRLDALVDLQKSDDKKGDDNAP